MTNYQPVGLSETIFKERYTIHPEESWENASQRVAEYVAKAENGEQQKYSEQFYEEIVTNRFMPAGRIWYGSGRKVAQLNNCFVISMPEDSREGWGKAISDTLIISGTGGGVGINFCLAPNTKVLTQDFEWKDLRNLKVGDKIIGLDEEVIAEQRHLRPSVVTATEPVKLLSYRIITEKGEMVVSSSHPILA